MSLAVSVFVTRTLVLDASGPAYLKRNFSALGFSCDNWQNEAITLRLMPVVLHGPNGATLPIDLFTPDTASLWQQVFPNNSRVTTIEEPTSPSGYALQITCGANTTSCGPADSNDNCPAGCLFDSDTRWCQSIHTTFVNRLPSKLYPLPTEVRCVVHSSKTLAATGRRLNL